MKIPEPSVGDIRSTLWFTMNYDKWAVRVFSYHSYIEFDDKQTSSSLGQYKVLKELPDRAAYKPIRDRLFTFDVLFVLNTGFDQFKELETNVRNLCEKWPERLRGDPRYRHFVATLALFTHNKPPTIPESEIEKLSKMVMVCLPNLYEYGKVFLFKHRHKSADGMVSSAISHLKSLPDHFSPSLLNFCDQTERYLENLSAVRYISAFDGHNNKTKRPVVLQRSIWRAKKMILKDKRLFERVGNKE